MAYLPQLPLFNINSSFQVSTDSKILKEQPLNSLWYSYDLNGVHYISISTKFLSVNFSENKSDDYQKFQKHLNWLENDLNAANLNRINVPWIVVNGFTSLYSSVSFNKVTEKILRQR